MTTSAARQKLQHAKWRLPVLLSTLKGKGAVLSVSTTYQLTSILGLSVQVLLAHQVLKTQAETAPAVAQGIYTTCLQLCSQTNNPMVLCQADPATQM